MNVLSLFSGIGGLELGLERAGMTVVGQVEIDPYCQRVLAKHWPEVPRHDDVRTAVEWWLNSRCEACGGTGYAGGALGDCYCRRNARIGIGDAVEGVQHRPRVDIVCGGFPCQPFSGAGLQLGIADERWGWPWFADIVRVLRPRYVVVENVAALLRFADAWGRVLGDLADLGFDAEWSVLSACAVGAPHRRRRVFLVAYPDGEGLQGLHETRGRIDLQPASPDLWRHWTPEPALARVADGIPRRLVLDDIRALGNAVVPQVAEHVGRLIVEHSKLVAA